MNVSCSHGGKLIIFYCITDGVLGCELPNGSFVEESNFHISSVKMKIKIKGMEAGWIVTVSDVLGEEAEQ